MSRTDREPLVTKRDVKDGMTILGLTGITWLAAVLVVLLIAAAVWGLTVLFAGTKGSGDVHKDQQSAQNREYWSTRYNTDYTNVQQDQSNIKTAQAALSDPSADRQDRINLVGLVNNCHSDVASYNADAANLLGRQWLPDGMPTNIDADQTCGQAVFPSATR